MIKAISPVFPAVVENGKLEIINKERYQAHLNNLTGDVDVRVDKHKKERSNEQNRYYWGVVIQILGDELGMLDDEAHEAMKMLFLRKVAFTTIGDVETIRSTASLSTKEFEAYLEKIRVWAATEMNIYIPLPNEVSY